ncbi:MAG: C10 family peptidase [Bacteroidales bacterium]|nr:C10 family peptidase [Bacteroidales bacterium]
MKRFTLLFSLLLLGITLSVYAKKVEVDQARQAGLNFYFERINKNQSVPFDALEITGEIVVAENDVTAYYIFNIGENGYIIVTADDQLFPVIGYSFETNWTNEAMPAHVQFWLDNYKGEILEAIAQGYPADQQITDAWERYAVPTPVTLPDELLLDVEPLITDIWDQDFPYNGMCPEDAQAGGSFNGRVPVGCVATAMSQIMHYWRHPETGQGSHCIVPQQTQYGPQCADFGTTTYEWDGMTDNPNKECDPVALLAWHCGISVDMQYGPTGSGAYVYKVANALKNYFKYSSTTYYAEKYAYSTSQWHNLLQTDLNAGRPVEYSGSGADGGHAWVCDGYQGSDYYHMNWGWGGAYNGYFYLTGLTPGGSYFNSNQTAVFQIKPDPAYYPSYCSGQTDLITYNFGALEDGSGPLEDYESNANCSWLIAPDDGVEDVTISFLRFDLASGDELNIYDGDSASDPLLGTYSGSALPPDVSTTGPAMYVTFITNGSGTAQGFLAEYYCDLINFCESTTNLTAPSGDISDGSGSYDYRNSTLCKWYIRPTDAATVILDFNSINTEETHDKILVYDLGTGTLLGTYSGNMTDPPTGITANSGEMLVMWITNKTVRGAGWDASYSITVGTEESAAVDDLYIYPNPAHDYLYVKFDGSSLRTVQLDLFSLKGTRVYTTVSGGMQGQIEEQINLQDFSKGVYMLRITSEQGVSNTKVIVQ